MAKRFFEASGAVPSIGHTGNIKGFGMDDDTMFVRIELPVKTPGRTFHGKPIDQRGGYAGVRKSLVVDFTAADLESLSKRDLSARRLVEGCQAYLADRRAVFSAPRPA